MDDANTDKRLVKGLGVAGLCLLASATLHAAEDTGRDCMQETRYTFSWSMADSCALAPRGGSSRGAPLTLDPEPHPGWLALQNPDLDRKERDRLAILAMAGPYRTSFEFLETVGYTPQFERSRPYQSWGTEYVYVVEDSEDFISLQHIMVMFAVDGEGSLMGPFVQKHWRQDWAYEKPELLVYAGHDTWELRKVGTEERDGTWAQSVFQVDDSPRYEAIGTWQHYPNFSTWISEPTWRPLPRRESSVRDDYQVLEATNRHSIVPNGWVHEEENYKLQLDANGERAGGTPYLSKELGVNRYERIIDFDFSAGDEYWERTGPFWADVRSLWTEFTTAEQAVQIVEEADGIPLFAALFEQAEVLTTENYDSNAAHEVIHDILDDYVHWQ